MSDPKVLLLDEPSLGLAPQLVDKIGEIITQINAQGTAVVLVEQNAAMALKVATHAIVLEVGEVGLSGPAAELAASDQVRDCVATQWFRYSAGRTEEVPDGCSLTTLQDAFGASGGDLGELVVAMTQTDAFWYRAPISP